MTLRDLGVRRAVIGAAWMRASLGMALLYEYAANYSSRYYFWGPDRVSQAFPLSGLSPYAWSNSSLYFDLLLLAGILVTVLFTVGIGGRFVTLCVYVMTAFLQDLNGLITDGGDNITRIVLLYMVFADLSGRRDREVSTISGVVHNAAILAIVVQLSLLYLSTGMYKAMGSHWQSGVALYYILRVNSFSWTGMGGEAIYENEYLVVALTYATVLFEIAFPFALFNSLDTSADSRHRVRISLRHSRHHGAFRVLVDDVESLFRVFFGPRIRQRQMDVLERCFRDPVVRRRVRILRTICWLCPASRTSAEHLALSTCKAIAANASWKLSAQTRKHWTRCMWWTGRVGCWLVPRPLFLYSAAWVGRGPGWAR